MNPQRFINGSVIAATFALLLLCAIGAAQSDKKFEYAILVDSTGSMRSQFDTVIQLTKGAVHQVHDHGPVSIYCFRTEAIGRPSRAVPTAVIKGANDEGLLNRAIDGIYIEGGQTTILDAIDLMTEGLKQSSGDRVIVLITDGEDRVSRVTREDVTRKLTATRTAVYAIGLIHDLEGGKRSKAKDLLSSLTKDTGGRVVFLNQPTDVSSVLNKLSIPVK